MTRVAVALAVVIALAAGVWMLWPDGERPPTTTSTLPLAAPSSSTSTAPLSTTTTADDHVVDTVEEAEAILRALWFGWFEGIYNEDENRIREVVLNDSQVEAARNQFGVMRFTTPPTARGITFDEFRILLSEETCLAIWSISGTDFLESAEARQGVDVLRAVEGQWVLFSSWKYEGDLWEADCGQLPG